MLRQVSFVPPYMRVQILFHAAYARIQHALRTAATLPSAVAGSTSALNGSYPVPVDVLLAPLLAALHHAYQVSQSSHLFTWLRNVSLLIADTLAQPSLSLQPAGGKYTTDIDSILSSMCDSNLKYKCIIFYLLTSLKLQTNYTNTYLNTLSTVTSAAVANTDLLNILTSCFQSSMNARLVDATANAENAANNAASKDAKGKGKDAKGKDAKEAAPSSLMTNRDAILLLTSLLRNNDSGFTLNQNMYGLYSFEHVLAQDIHTLLAQVDSQYKSSFILSSLPNATSASVVVPVNSLSCTWQTIANGVLDPDLGLYNMAECMILLGDVVNTSTASTAPPAKGSKPAGKDAPGDTAGGPSTEPTLKKFQMPRDTLVKIEKELRDIDDLLVKLEDKADSVLMHRYAVCVHQIYHVLRFRTAFSDSGEELYTYNDGKMCFLFDKFTVKLCCMSKQVLLLADLMTSDRCLLNAADMDVCYLIRISLGCAKYVKM
ncbi:hypothetical protein EON65_01670 [archaeon]|nr:MAG: hypothetical protein EON65_01670 [archaeon]